MFYIRVFITFCTHVSAGNYGHRRVELQYNTRENWGTAYNNIKGRIEVEASSLQLKYLDWINKRQTLIEQMQRDDVTKQIVFFVEYYERDSLWNWSINNWIKLPLKKLNTEVVKVWVITPYDESAVEELQYNFMHSW